MSREGHNFTKTIEESIFIRVNNLTLNKNIGKYYLPHVWDTFLFNTTELKVENKQEQQVHNIFSQTWWNHLVWRAKAGLQLSFSVFQEPKSSFFQLDAYQTEWEHSTNSIFPRFQKPKHYLVIYSNILMLNSSKNSKICKIVQEWR